MPRIIQNVDESPSSPDVMQPGAGNTRVKVLIVSGTLSGGGAERFVSTLLQHLDRSQVEPSLCLFRDEICYPLPADVDVSILGHDGPLHCWRTVRRLADVIRETRPDVVLSAMDYLGMFVGEALKSCSPRPTWIARTSNNPRYLFRSVRGRLRKLWLNRVYPQADYFVANSGGLAESFASAFSCAAGRTQVLLNPVDTQRLERLSSADWPETIDTSVPNLFYSARLRSQKRPDLLIEAFRIVHRQSPARLWICGHGPMRGKVESLIERYGLRDHVRMVGFRENIFPLLKAATLAVATSDYEGLPNSLLEAQAMGVPVVSTRSAFGPEEIIDHGETGLLVERGNPAAIANAMIRLLSDDGLCAHMSTRAAHMVQQRFALDKTMPAWTSLFCQVAETSTVSEPLKSIA